LSIFEITRNDLANDFAGYILSTNRYYRVLFPMSYRTGRCGMSVVKVWEAPYRIDDDPDADVTNKIREELREYYSK